MYKMNWGNCCYGVSLVVHVATMWILLVAFAWVWMVGTTNAHNSSNFHKLKFIKILNKFGIRTLWRTYPKPTPVGQLFAQHSVLFICVEGLQFASTGHLCYKHQLMLPMYPWNIPSLLDEELSNSRMSCKVSPTKEAIMSKRNPTKESP